MTSASSLRFPPSGLAGRVALAFGVLAVLLVTALGLLIRSAADSLLEEQIRLTLNQVAASTRDRLDRKMADFCRDVKSRAEAELVENPGRSVNFRRRSIDYLKHAWPEFSWIAYVRADGVVEQASAGMLEGINVSQRPWFGRALADDPVTDVHEAKLLQALLGGNSAEPLRFVDIAYPLKAADGKAYGVLGVHVSWDFAKSLVRSTRQLNYRVRGLDILVYDTTGKVLLGPDGEPGLPGHIVESVKSQNEVVLHSNRAGDVGHVVAYSATRGLGEYPGLGWIVAARQDLEAAYQPVRRLDRQILIWGVAAVLLFALVGGIFARRLVRPLSRLTAAADRLAAGEREVAFPHDSGVGEVERLSDALGSMVRALAENEQALREANVSLEERVVARTRELAQTTEALARERERLTFSLDGSRIAAWDVDPNTGQAWLSAEWSVMLGGERIETNTSYSTLVDLVPAEERERVLRLQMGVLKGQLPHYDIEHRVTRPDGTRFWIRSRGTVTRRDVDGKALRIAGTNTDITRSKMAEAELRQSERKLRLITDNLPFMITFVDREMRLLFINRTFLNFLGLQNADATNLRLKDVVGEEAERKVMDSIPKLEAGEFVHYERQRADRHGRIRHLDVTQIPHFSADGALLGCFSLIEDNTEKYAAARELAASEERLRLVLDSVPAAVCEVDLNGRILFTNRRYDEFYHLRPGEATGRLIQDVSGKAGHDRFLKCVPQLAQGRQVVYQRETSLQDGRTVYLEVNIVPGQSGTGTVDRAYAMISDITERKQVETALAHQAITDNLTGLPNRRLLIDRFSQSLAQARRNKRGLAVLYMDLDGFKPVNDSMGHAAGDELLRKVSVRLSGAVRAGDTVARIGGDEFVVLLDPCDTVQDAETVSEKIIRSLKPDFDLSQGRAVVSASIGIALFPDDALDADALLAHADRGLYAAKAAGKGRYVRISG